MQISAIQVRQALEVIAASKSQQAADPAAPTQAVATRPATPIDTFEPSEALLAGKAPSTAAEQLTAAVGSAATVTTNTKTATTAADVLTLAPEPTGATSSGDRAAQASRSGGAESAGEPAQIPPPVQPRTYSPADRDALLAAWGARPGEQRFSSEYDLDGDGQIGSRDLALLLGNFQDEATSAPASGGGQPAPTQPGQEPALPESPDLTAIRAAWNTRAGEPGYDPTLDFDGDGRIGSADLALFLGGANRPAAPAPPEAQASADVPFSDQVKTLLASWGARLGEKGYNAAYDLDGDGVINSSDLANLLGRANQPS